MNQLPDPGINSQETIDANYSPRLRRAFNLAALGVALLPIPVALLRLLPAYSVHSRFLAFYAPVVCLLTLAYLIYVRDSLARMMFAHLLNPLPPAVGYYPERGGIRVRRLLSRCRSSFLALLPGVLLLAAPVCVIRYTARLADSVQVATITLANNLATPDEVGLLPASRGRASSERTRSPRGNAQPRAPSTRVALPTDTASLRQRALTATTTADIPYFGELTTLYIGSFLAPLVALLLMGLREYAKEALGLSERDVVLGRILVEPE